MLIAMLPDELGLHLICPDCRRPLVRVKNSYLCADGQCRRAYPIVDEIPKLLVDDSETLELPDWEQRIATVTPAH